MAQLIIAVSRLDWLSSSVPTDETPLTAERVERGVVSALTVLCRRIRPDVAGLADDYLIPDVLHVEPPAAAEAAV